MKAIASVDTTVFHWFDAWRAWYEKEPPVWRLISHWKWRKSFPRMEDFEHESGQGNSVREGTP